MTSLLWTLWWVGQGLGWLLLGGSFVFLVKGTRAGRQGDQHYNRFFAEVSALDDRFVAGPVEAFETIDTLLVHTEAGKKLYEESSKDLALSRHLSRPAFFLFLVTGFPVIVKLIFS